MSLVQVLPAVNATLNATSGACLLTGYIFMKRHQIQLHRRFMLALHCAQRRLFVVNRRELVPRR